MANPIGSLWLFKEFWGFDAIPVNVDIEIFMKLLLNCANGDGTLTQAERDWVTGYAAALGGPPALIEELNTYVADEHIPTLASSRATVMQSRRALVYDAIRTCSADSEYHAAEQSLVRRLAAAVGVTEDIVRQLELLYAQDRQLRGQRLNLIWYANKPY